MSQRIAPSWRSGNYARSAGEAKYPQAWKGLVGLWRPSMGYQGARLIDWSLGRNHGTLTNGPTYVAGRRGQALSFDGVDDYVSVANESNFDFDKTSTFTISAWVKTTTSAGANMIFGKADNGGGGGIPGYYLNLRQPASDAFVNFDLINSVGSAGRRLQGGTKINDGIWHHVVATNSGAGTIAGMKLYVDGVEESYTTVLDTDPGSILNNVIPAIGARGTSTSAPNPFPGLIDDVRIYNRALSAAEVMADYLGQFDPLQLRRLVTYFVPTTVKPWLYTYPQPIIGGGLAA